MIAILAAIEAEDNERNAKKRAEMQWKRHLRDNSDPFMMGDNVFHQHYRMPPLVAIELIELLRPHLDDHERGVPPHLQVLAVLRFLAEGSYQKGVAADLYHPMSQPTFSKYLHSVIPAILEHADEFIRFPSSREEREAIQQGFQERLGFPGVIGAIDCTLPNIHTPVDHEEAYVNYKHQHSFCVQTVCDVNYNIMNIRVCSGSTNDRFVWRHSEVRQEMLRLRADDNVLDEEGPYYFIADSGYTPSRVLLTPINDAAHNTPEFRFSDALRRTRCRVEQTFGIWKEIMRCINADRTLHYQPEFGANIVLASGVLYNFLRHQGMPFPDPPEEFLPNHFFFEEENEFMLGVLERDEIINQFFQ